MSTTGAKFRMLVTPAATSLSHIAWAALSENGVEIDRDTHAGFTGVAPVKPAYILRLPARRPGATYTLSASVQGRGGTNSNGIIYRPNWD